MTMTEQSSSVPSSPVDDEVPGPARSTGRQLRELLADDVWLDELIDRAEAGGVRLTGEGGFLPEMIKAVLERGMKAELTDHLGYQAGDAAGRGSGNSRNGTTPKTIATEIGEVRWTSLGTVIPRSPRRWCPRAPAAWAG